MENIILNVNETYFLSKGEFLLIKKGKVVSKNILSNGRIISNNDCLRKDEIIFNYFNFLEEEEEEISTIEIEVEALEDSILERLKLSKKSLNENIIYNSATRFIVKSYNLLKIS